MRLSQRIRKCLFPLTRRIRAVISPTLKDGGIPAGIFSEAEQINAERVTGQILAPNARLEIPTGSELILAKQDQAKHQEWRPVWTVRENAFLAAPSLVHADEHDRIAIEALYACHAWRDPVWRRAKANKLPLETLQGDFTSIISGWNDGTNYFHWFMDGLSRLVHLENFPPDCKIIIPAELPPFARQSLECLGLSDRTVPHSGTDLQVERYWFAGPTMLSGCLDPRAVKWLREKLLKSEPENGNRRIYIERNAPTRNLNNATEMRDLFRSDGWEIVDPATLRFEQQIELFRDASHIVGVHGAGLTNLLWAPKQAQVLEFMPSRRRNACYSGISLSIGIAHTTLVCPSDRSGNIDVPTAFVRQWLSTAQKLGPMPAR